MTCDRCRGMADSYVAGELPVDTTQELITHLETCSACRAEVEARQRLGQTLRGAFSRSARLAPDAEFLAQVRTQLKREHARAPRRSGPPAWLAVAATVLALIGVAALVIWMERTPSTVDWARLAAHAAGDHRYCAVQHALDEAPISLEEAADRYDPRYRRIREVVEASVPVRDGDVEVLGAHACVFQGRRFAHVVVRRRNHVVSVLVTDTGQQPRRANSSSVIACGPADGFQVSCSSAGGYSVFVVSDLPSGEHLELARALSPALQRHLTGA